MKEISFLSPGREATASLLTPLTYIHVGQATASLLTPLTYIHVGQARQEKSLRSLRPGESYYSSY